MKLTAFRIENYRSILDSGWVNVDDIAVIVGKNESGKTSLLKALWKFNPYHEAQYDLDREWPRDRRKEKSLDKIVATVRFELSPEEIGLVEAVHESAKGITAVEIKRSYRGTYYHTFLPHSLAHGADLECGVSLLRLRLSTLPKGFSESFRQQYFTAFNALLKEVRENGGTRHARARLPEFKSRLTSFIAAGSAAEQQDLKAMVDLNKTIDEVINDLKSNPLRHAADIISSRLPTFIYMDEYRIFRGAAHLDEVKQRKDNGKATKEDETLVAMMEMAGLDLEDEVAKGRAGNKEQRMLDLNDASISLTDEIASRWSQKGYEVRFEVDGQHFITFVRDVGATALVPLEERSKGFQWFFSFDMMFLYETRGSFENAVILLDEPGLHLHAAGQRDLLDRMAAYAERNQLIYTTHLPFMIEPSRLDNIHVAEEFEKVGTQVHQDWATADKDARYTLQAALALAWGDSVVTAKHNLIVESVTDFWLLTAMSTLLRDAGQSGLDEHLVITPAGGASMAAYIATLLHTRDVGVAVLLDSDLEGDAACEQLIEQWTCEKHVVRAGSVLGVAQQRTLEDLFDDVFYINHVNAAYRKELNGGVLSTAGDKSKGIVERVGHALKAKGVDKFNKARVAKRIIDELPKKKLSDLPRETVENFRKMIGAINSIAESWRQGGALPHASTRTSTGGRSLEPRDLKETERGTVHWNAVADVPPPKTPRPVLAQPDLQAAFNAPILK